MAGTSLLGLQIGSSYSGLLKTTDNAVLSGTLRTITDGLGNDSALQVSTAGVKSTGTFVVTGATTLATLAATTGTFSGAISSTNFTGSSTGTNTGDQTNIAGNAATVTTNANLTGDVTSVGNATTLGTVPVAKGGTGQTTAAAARTAFGVGTGDTPTFVGLTGVAAASNAAAGVVGEYISSALASGSAVGLSTGVSANITSIALTAGDWDVFGVVGMKGIYSGTATILSLSAHGISPTSATLGDENDTSSITLGVGMSADCRFTVPSTRVSIAAPTTYYLVVNAAFVSNTLVGYGRISARRAR